ncbi:hypothetical protein RV09_GL000704 [Enterococcus moraviensis]|nr:hypothetical protein RV09_GL000704 [Enterococcus moraviensis]
MALFQWTANPMKKNIVMTAQTAGTTCHSARNKLACFVVSDFFLDTTDRFICWTIVNGIGGN